MINHFKLSRYVEVVELQSLLFAFATRVRQEIFLLKPMSVVVGASYTEKNFARS
jgi:hypothetical protein